VAGLNQVAAEGARSTAAPFLYAERAVVPQGRLWWIAFRAERMAAGG
jgi:hypothetical protein